MSGLCLEQTGVKFGLVPLFFPRSEHVAGSIRAFDDGLVLGVDRLCSYGVPPPCPSPLQSYGLDIGIFLRLAGFCLQFGRGSPCCGLPVSSRYHRSAGSGGLLA